MRHALIALTLSASTLGACAAMAGEGPAAIPASVESPATANLTYADLASLADAAPLVIEVEVKDQTPVEIERSPGLAPGHVRLYLEAQTLSLLTGNVPVGEYLRYLADVPLDAKGKVPKLRKGQFILFARPVPGRPGEVQLVSPAGQLALSAPLEERLRPILRELAAPDAPPAITGIRDALAVEGTLVGESETQIFLDTATGDPASITVTRRPGQAPRWGVSWSDIVDQAATAPARDTLAWYRLACALPPRLPASANLARDPQARDLAAQDYAFVLARLGECSRAR